MTSLWSSLRRSALTAGGVLMLAGAGTAAQAEKVVRAVMHADLKAVDPIWSTAYISRNHGYMIYDTLFAIDAKGEIQPQMAESYKVSDDQLTHTVTMRDGLLWHDGAPVTSEDCVASIKRWAAKDALGITLMTFVDSVTAPDAKTIVIKLKSPTGLVKLGLAKPSGVAPFMMPKRVADTDPNKQIEDFTGSGPFVFKKDEWKPGDKAVYVKFDKYKPRAEPASGLAGGKVVKVDRVEWRVISDPQQATTALTSGEIDYIEQPSIELFPLLKKSADVALFESPNQTLQYVFRPNSRVKPFDDPKVKAALWYAFNQQDFAMATIGNADYIKECKAIFICGSPFSSNAGMDGLLTSNMKKAQEVLKESGYDGTPIVLLHSTDLKVLTNLAPVAKGLMEKAGFKVDMQDMDWGTLIQRRAKLDEASKGGWNAFLTAWSATDVINPVSAAMLNTDCQKAAPGSPCDEVMEKIRADFARESDPAKQKALAEAAQKRAIEITPFIPLGEWVQPIAHRKTITGIVDSAVPVFWNMEIK